MSLLGRYVLRQATILVGGLILLALCVLMLERMLRILEVVSVSSRPATDAARMVLNLVPHYLGLAVPAALLLGTVITVDKLSRSEEMTAMLASGVPMTRIAKPFFVLAAVTSALTLVTEGYLQPHSRYGYREAVHQAVQQTFTGAFREGKFVAVGDRTFWTRDEIGVKGGVEGVFIHERGEDGSVRVTTAPGGLLTVNPETRVPSLVLAGGNTVAIGPDGVPEAAGSFGSLSFSGAEAVEAFRERGEDERELTLTELGGMLGRDRPAGQDAEALSGSVVSATFHARLARAAVLLTFPLLAIPLGLSFGRAAKSGGVVLGLLFLVALQKAMEWGAGASASGALASWLGPWLVVAVSGSLGGWLFWRAAYTTAPPPMESLPSLPQLPRLRLGRAAAPAGA